MKRVIPERILLYFPHMTRNVNMLGRDLRDQDLEVWGIYFSLLINLKRFFKKLVNKLDVGITAWFGIFTLGVFYWLQKLLVLPASFWKSKAEQQTLSIRPQIRQQMATLDSLRPGWLQLEMSPSPFQVSTMLGWTGNWIMSKRCVWTQDAAEFLLYLIQGLHSSQVLIRARTFTGKCSVYCQQ